MTLHRPIVRLGMDRVGGPETLTELHARYATSVPPRGFRSMSYEAWIICRSIFASLLCLLAFFAVIVMVAASGGKL